ncbi:serine--tRNA ligase [Erythrobacter litoralis]|uniref:serine--tRNA ligase n=1 Tax=Erythrobacter litoralis TaxID=39960 RepID=UPI002435748A|nr:serine--tRNA ligase [Erythrobacter litoralis]MDG6077807.1 serine--tRNA ligase [Erythrobacter litoralis]
MHDIAYIRANPQKFDAAMKTRGGEPVADHILALDARKREAMAKIQDAQNRRNGASKAIGQAMSQGDKERAEALKAEVAEIKAGMPEWEAAEKVAGDELDALLAGLPNIPADDVPEGADESDNVEVASWGTKRHFDFDPQEHADIGPALGMEFETGAAMSGARFTFLRGGMARLHRALAQFMLNRQTGERGYIECNPPVLVRDEALYGTGQLPKFGEDSFQTREGHWLIPTAEVSLTNSVREQILDPAALPMRLTAHTPCFRSEAGAAGRDTRGFIRQHQFEKVELVSICAPDDWEAEHEHMVASAQGILEALELPYRTMLLCTGDMGATAKKTFDLEVWLPGQGAYREISSISWCGDYQARRMSTRYRPEGEKKTRFVHTLNGSGLAVGRTLVAVMENYQDADGSVAVPDVLAPYMGGITKLSPAS